MFATPLRTKSQVLPSSLSISLLSRALLPREEKAPFRVFTVQLHGKKNSGVLACVVPSHWLAAVFRPSVP